jgi:hypothetical protein
MNKFSKIAALVFCVAAAANAQIKGIGYDAGSAAGEPSQITARLGLGANFLDVGVGMRFDNAAKGDAKFEISASGYFLGHLHDFGPVDTYFTAGGVFHKLPREDDNVAIAGFVGFQPEVTLLDHIVLSTRLGLRVPLMPDFGFQTSGDAISIVNGANFKILF